MPKIKTHSSSKKRFSLTSTGKVKMAHAFKRKKLTKKTAKRKMSLRKSAIASSANADTIKMMIPYK